MQPLIDLHQLNARRHFLASGLRLGSVAAALLASDHSNANGTGTGTERVHPPLPEFPHFPPKPPP
ncbi:MAG UNVERIFIED_CONTAM: hypothetical protein LVR18_20935 [Planctomycetaceae bacterium]|jgi:hypothetical protein